MTAKLLFVLIAVDRLDTCYVRVAVLIVVDVASAAHSSTVVDVMRSFVPSVRMEDSTLVSPVGIDIVMGRGVALSASAVTVCGVRITRMSS